MKTKGLSKRLALFLVFCMAFTMLPTGAFAETVSEAPKIKVSAASLPVPTVPQWNWETDGSLKVSWDPVAGASSYQVMIYKNEDSPLDVDPIPETELYINPPIGEGHYAFTVAAVGDGINYITSPHSPKSTVLDVSITPTNTSEQLKTALESTIPAIINVTSDIELTSFITLGASHRLNIYSGETIYTKGTKSYDCLVQIPEGLTLTLTGPGTLKSDNIDSSGLSVGGTLMLEPGSRLVSASRGPASGINLSYDSTPGNIVSNGGHIILENSGENSVGIASGSFGSQLTLNGGTLTISNSGNGSRGIHTVDLAAKDGCLITINSSGNANTSGIYTNQNTTLKSSSLAIENTTGTGLLGGFSAEGSTVTVKNSGGIGINIRSGFLLALTSNSILNLENGSGSIGLHHEQFFRMTVDHSTVNVKNGGGVSLISNNTYTPVVGRTCGWFVLNPNAQLENVQSLFSDQGNVLNTNGLLIVGEAGGSPASSGLTAGEYGWTGIRFNKGTSTSPAITITQHPQDVTVTQGRISGTLTTYAVACNGSPILYQWHLLVGGIGSDNTDPVPGATGSSFTIPTNLAPGTYRYLCSFTTDGINYEDSNTAIVTVNPPSGGSGSSSGGSSAPPPVITPPQTLPGQPVTATAPVTATGSINGMATANIPANAISGAITRAQSTAQSQGNSENGIAVNLRITMPPGLTSLTMTIPQSALQSLATAGATHLEISGSPVSLNLNQGALQAILNQADGDITIGMAPVTGLSSSAQSVVGNRPVYNITIRYTDKNGKTQNITDFRSGVATLAIPYTPGSNEIPGYLFGVYVDGKGNPNRIPDSRYDGKGQRVLIPTNHLSVYGVGYGAPSTRFTDVANHWAKDSIDYVVGRGLFKGTSETTFAPNAPMTRGMLVTVLGRLAGIDETAYTASSFTDVKTDSLFRPSIEWAYTKGIAKGIGNRQFAPDRPVTRQEIAVILVNYAKVTGYTLPIIQTASSYEDDSSIGSLYKTAVTAMQDAGIMTGSPDNKFSPKTNATRAEVSSVLYRYINPDIGLSAK